MPLTQALAAIAKAHQTVLDDLSALIGFDTSYPPGRHYPNLVDWAEARLAPLGFTCQRIDVPDALWDVPHAKAAGRRTNLIADRPIAGADRVGIYGHMDVVPADAAGWSSPPFAATSDATHVYGRGAADMKASIAALVLAMQAAHEHAVSLRLSPRILLTTDEEGGAYPGIRYLAEQGLVPTHLLCLDGTPAPRIWTGSFGSLELLLEVDGRAGHAGQRGSGDNALERAIPILAALLSLKASTEARQSQMRGPDGERLRPILAITMAQAGTKANIIPGRCTVALNRRYAPEEHADAVLAELQATIAAAAPPGTGWQLYTTGHLAPVRDADQGPDWTRWTAAMATSFGWSPAMARPYGSTSSSDMGWVQRSRAPGEPTEILLGGAIRADSRVHDVNERVAIADVQALAAATLRYLAAEGS
jgi:succinyl-diaminopimelate desuccinylase